TRAVGRETPTRSEEAGCRRNDDFATMFRALRWLWQAATAVDAAHELGIVDRDVMPHNLLLDIRDNLRLRDFGIAAALDGSARAPVRGARRGRPRARGASRALACSRSPARRSFRHRARLRARAGERDGAGLGDHAGLPRSRDAGVRPADACLRP